MISGSAAFQKKLKPATTWAEHAYIISKHEVIHNHISHRAIPENLPEPGKQKPGLNYYEIVAIIKKIYTHFWTTLNLVILNDTVRFHIFAPMQKIVFV